MNKPFVTPPDFKPYLHTVRFDTTLPYNCIYFVSGRKKDSDYGRIYLNPRDNNIALTIQDFPFFTQEIHGSHRDNIKELRAWSFSSNPFFYDKEKEILSILRDIFPESEEGCFVVRLLPYREQLKDNFYDTLLVCESKWTPNFHFYNETLRKFVVEAARNNYERMTGNFYDTKGHHCTFYPKGFFKDRDWINEIKSLYRPLRPNHLVSPNTRAARIYESEEIKEMRKKLANDYKKQFEYFYTPDTFTFDYKTFINVIRSAYHDIDDIDKISTLCPIKILPYDKSYDIFICPKDRKPIRCDFSRGYAAKALYIFFLRHPEGFHLMDFNRQYIQELAIIYKKLKGGDDETVFEKAKVIATAGTRAQKGSRAENLNDIRNWFKEHFINKLANDYAIAPIDYYLTLYGINIPKEMIDLGIFGFPFNPDL